MINENNKTLIGLFILFLFLILIFFTIKTSLSLSDTQEKLEEKDIKISQIQTKLNKEKDKRILLEEKLINSNSTEKNKSNSNSEIKNEEKNTLKINHSKIKEFITLFHEINNETSYKDNYQALLNLSTESFLDNMYTPERLQQNPFKVEIKKINIYESDLNNKIVVSFVQSVTTQNDEHVKDVHVISELKIENSKVTDIKEYIHQEEEN